MHRLQSFVRLFVAMTPKTLKNVIQMAKHSTFDWERECASRSPSCIPAWHVQILPPSDPQVPCLGHHAVSEVIHNVAKLSLRFIVVVPAVVHSLRHKQLNFRLRSFQVRHRTLLFRFCDHVALPIHLPRRTSVSTRTTTCLAPIPALSVSGMPIRQRQDSFSFLLSLLLRSCACDWPRRRFRRLLRTTCLGWRCWRCWRARWRCGWMQRPEKGGGLSWKP